MQKALPKTITKGWPWFNVHNSRLIVMEHRYNRAHFKDKESVALNFV